MKRFISFLILFLMMLCVCSNALDMPVTDEIAKGDLMLLARLIHAECDGRDWTEMVKCGAQCIERTKNGYHCTTIAGVIFEEGLYESVSNGNIYNSPSVLAIRAAEEALLGMLSEG